MTGGLISATLPWDGIDAPRPHRRHIAMDLPQPPRQRQDLREHEDLCDTCPLPLDWCRGGDRGERQDSPCPYLRAKRELPPLTEDELAAIWAAHRSGAKVKDWWKAEAT